jgi:alkylation response protein AidB-like acyl-CoA dehydrogenase
LDVTVGEKQSMLQQATRRFAQERLPVTALRKFVESRTTFGADAWRECAAQGWLALFTPEAFGGMAEEAQGVIDAAIIAEELGRVVFAGPFLPACVVAFAVARAGSDVQRGRILPGLCSGDLRAAWCFAGWGPEAGLEPNAVRVTRAGSDAALNGVASYVEDAEGADMFLVSAMDEGGLSQFLIPAKTQGLKIEPLRSLDLGRVLATVRFDSVRVGDAALLGQARMAAEDFERQLQVAVVLQCAEIVGLVDRALEFTLEYVQQRVAFGRVIGSFQALKHRLADHVAQLETAKAATAHAARAVQNQAPDRAIAVSIAKSHCGRYGTEIIRDCLQMHGGIGMTWDHDIHFYLRRAVSNEALWGSPPLHHERLCRLAGL